MGNQGTDMITKDKWKEKFTGLINTCQDELKKTTEIGKKMFAASKANTDIRDCYEKLGQMLFNALEKNELDWKDPKVEKLCKKINDGKKNLESIEADVQAIKSEPEAGQNDQDSKR